jgi:hypothetical protein
MGLTAGSTRPASLISSGSHLIAGAGEAFSETSKKKKWKNGVTNTLEIVKNP